MIMADKGDDLGTKPRKVTVMRESQEENMFMEARQAELKGLLDNGTFKPVPQSGIPSGARVFVSRFVDELKRAETGLRKNSRPVS